MTTCNHAYFYRKNVERTLNLSEKQKDYKR